MAQKVQYGGQIRLYDVKGYIIGLGEKGQQRERGDILWSCCEGQSPVRHEKNGRVARAWQKSFLMSRKCITLATNLLSYGRYLNIQLTHTTHREPLFSQTLSMYVRSLTAIKRQIVHAQKIFPPDPIGTFIQLYIAQTKGKSCI